MERGRKIALTFALIIWIVLLGFTFYYLYNVYNSITEEVPVIEAYEFQRVEPNGEQVSITRGDIVSIELDEHVYSFKMYEVTPTTVEFVVNDFLYFGLKEEGEKKLDFNSDNIYDLRVMLHEKGQNTASISFSISNERQSIGGDVVETIDRFEKDAQLQRNAMILVMLITLLILIYYIIKAFIIPKVEEKKRLSRKTESEAFNDLYEQFNRAIKKEDGEKAQKVHHKAKHLYRYMSDEDKKQVKSRFERMTNYLK